jgi:hypothetical protein
LVRSTDKIKIDREIARKTAELSEFLKDMQAWREEVILLKREIV